MCVCVCCVSALLKYLNVCVCSVSAFLKCYYVCVCGVSAFSFFYVVRVCSVSADMMQTTVVCGQGCLCPFNSGSNPLGDRSETGAWYTDEIDTTETLESEFEATWVRCEADRRHWYWLVSNFISMDSKKFGYRNFDWIIGFEIKKWIRNKKYEVTWPTDFWETSRFHELKP